MFGREYLDWKSEYAAGEAIDAFLAAMEPEDRKWVLAVMRERFEVRVEYRDSPLERLAKAASRQQALRNTPSALAAEHHRVSDSIGGTGSVLMCGLGL